MRAVHERHELQEAHVRGHVVAWAPVSTYWNWALVGCAWGVVVLGTLTRQNQWIDHDYLLEHSGLPWLMALAVFLVCWQVMTAAMMAPSVLLVLHAHILAKREEWSRAAEAVLLTGYFLIWTGFAAVAFLGDMGVHTLVDRWLWLSEHPQAIGAITLVVAGVFEFSPVKRHSLAACQTAFGSLTGEGRNSASTAWQCGMRHGRACLVSGWALMLVMFGLGVDGVLWMLALTGVMTAEKVLPTWRWLAPVVGCMLLALALLWWIHPGWLPSVDA